MGTINMRIKRLSNHIFHPPGFHRRWGAPLPPLHKAMVLKHEGECAILFHRDQAPAALIAPGRALLGLGLV